MQHILIIDDEPAIRESLVYALERDGFETRQADTLSDAREGVNGASLIILDLMLPDGSGLDFLKKLRLDSAVPVIILTSRDDETDRVVGLELGADDYVVKPFSPREVVARVRAVMRRTAPKETETDSEEAEINGPEGISINPATRRVFVATSEIDLTKLEFDLLAVLVRSPGRVYTRGQLLDMVWGADCVVGERTVDVHLKSLRQRLREGGLERDIIETVRGVGYRISEGEQ
ncbi:MAG: response regulator transcription factor [Deltaproteobacteria bacterium]|nr:response regulator transcription factor [Deltaproteobacteria bacterium]